MGRDWEIDRGSEFIVSIIPPAREQLNKLLNELRVILSDDLTGVYLHGSLAMGCFNPNCSDIDLLAVVNKPLSVETRRHLAESLLRQSGDPFPLEISVIGKEENLRWRHPAPYEFHFSEDWRIRMTRDLATDEWKQWHHEPQYDDDLAAHITVTHCRGITLFGEDASATLPEVPKRDYVASLLSDVEWAIERLDKNPIYAVLNLCRVLGYLRTGQILSKAEGATGTLECATGTLINTMPDRLQNIVRIAHSYYTGNTPKPVFETETLEAYVDWMKTQIEEEAGPLLHS